MGKKRQRAKQVSKSVTHQNPKRMGNKISKALRREWNESSARVNAQVKAFLQGKNVMLTVPNPDKNNTKERFIRVNAKEVWKQVSKN